MGSRGQTTFFDCVKQGKINEEGDEVPRRKVRLQALGFFPMKMILWTEKLFMDLFIYYTYTVLFAYSPIPQKKESDFIMSYLEKWLGKIPGDTSISSRLAALVYWAVNSGFDMVNSPGSGCSDLTVFSPQSCSQLRSNELTQWVEGLMLRMRTQAESLDPVCHVVENQNHHLKVVF
ncbi:hypothetical protein STEG23_017351 [Scotinomys teguina]